MNKKDVIEYFNEAARDWDLNTVKDSQKIRKILDFAGIREGVKVLDVACGTGVLTPDYLERNVSRVTGIDISTVMIDIAQSKYEDSRLEFINADVEEYSFCEVFDCCVVYNAFPHFESPERLVKSLAEKLEQGGRLTIAHGMSREQLEKHHLGVNCNVRIQLLEAEELADIFRKDFDTDVILSDESIYVVSGCKR